MEDEADFRKRLLLTSNQILLAQLRRYGILEETVREFEISYQVTGGLEWNLIIPLHDPFGLRIGYAAVSDSGRMVIAPQTLIEGELLYNCHRAVATGSKQVIVVQDILDCLRVSQCGFRAVVALLGQSMSETQEIEIVARFRAVVLIFCGDETGWALSQSCVRRLVTQVSVHAAVLPSNQAVRDLSDEDLAAALRSSTLLHE
jgi:Toprim domain